MCYVLPALDGERAAERAIGAGLLKGLLLALLLYAFFVGLDLMGLSFKLFGRGLAEELITRTGNPFVGLFVGILTTTLVQSSSTTTSMTVGLVAAGALTVEGAVPIIMGANIGTSVTNTLVALGHVTRPEEFRRAFAGATVHDFFNWMSVLVLFPLELGTGFLSRAALGLEGLLEGAGGMKLADPLRAVVRPASEWIANALGRSGSLTLVVGLGLLFLALRFLVRLLRVVFTARAEQVLHKTLFRSATAAVAAGVAMTVMVQSSSITTSVMVPLVGAGMVTLEQAFPFTIGANLGTTVTAMLAALATGNASAVAVAFSHLLFNLCGGVMIYPVPAVRRIPLGLARGLGTVASRNRALAVVYIVGAFYGLPILLLLLSGGFG